MARPAEFDRREVLDKAMEVFWRTGFTATSVADLVSATSLKPGSLYSAFESKRGLFVEVIDTYAARRIENAQQVLENAEDPLNAIYAFFERLRQDACQDEIGRGCLMINTMLELATEDDDL
ncbi:MAG: TetR/AcrR family transcriptional regulator, partial [Marinobacterium sp.]|nr:TetR/AcrR family transcriptional regulator [Marinobacterium sp.]